MSIEGHFDKKYPEFNLNFLTFMLFAMPVSIIMIFLSWTWLNFRWLPNT